MILIPLLVIHFAYQAPLMAILRPFKRWLLREACMASNRQAPVPLNIAPLTHTCQHPPTPPTHTLTHQKPGVPLLPPQCMLPEVACCLLNILKHLKLIHTCLYWQDQILVHTWILTLSNPSLHFRTFQHCLKSNPWHTGTVYSIRMIAIHRLLFTCVNIDRRCL